MGRILAVCSSPARGTEKRRVGSGRFTPEWGLVGDAHGGDWHRQVSLLSAEKIKAFNERGAGVEYGAFGENLVVEGVDLRALPVGTRLRCGQVLLELTQIGKECLSGGGDHPFGPGSGGETGGSLRPGYSRPPGGIRL